MKRLVLLSCGCRVTVKPNRAHVDAGFPCVYHGQAYVIYVFDLRSPVSKPFHQDSFAFTEQDD